MHNKFFVIDGRFVVTGTGNITTTGFGKNDNNWVMIDSPEVAPILPLSLSKCLMGGLAMQSTPSTTAIITG